MALVHPRRQVLNGIVTIRRSPTWWPAPERRPAGLGCARRAVRPADLVHLPRYRLGDTDAEDVGQRVWLRLVEQLRRLRDPAALPGWLATVTRRECVRALRAAQGPYAAG